MPEHYHEIVDAERASLQCDGFDDQGERFPPEAGTPQDF